MTAYELTQQIQAKYEELARLRAQIQALELERKAALQREAFRVA